MLMQTSLLLSTTVLKKKEWLVLIDEKTYNLILEKPIKEKYQLKPIVRRDRVVLVKYYQGYATQNELAVET
jgi:hypothetical protein